MIRIHWEGYYLDGKTADKKEAQIQLLNEGLKIVIAATGESFVWPYGETRQTQGFYAGEPVQIERGGNIPEIIIIEDQEFLASLHSFARNEAKKFHDPAFRPLRTRLVIYSATAIIAAGVFMFLFGIPLLAKYITPRVPIEWEQGLGESALKIIAPEDERCTNPKLQQALDEIVDRLKAAENSPYTFKVFVVESKTFNALALPGGNIVIFSGLLEKTETPEELASVIAHEMEHIKKRHVTKKVIQDSSTGIILSALSGDATGSMVYGASVARTLAMLNYSREDEEEADESGMKTLVKADINPREMINMFSIMMKEGHDFKIPKYISTHPGTDDRIRKLEFIAGGLNPRRWEYRKFSFEGDWNEIKKSCSTAKPGNSQN